MQFLTAICILLFGLFVLVGCAGDESLTINSEPLQIEVARPADPTPINTLPIQFRVINKDNLNSFLAEITQTQGNTPVFIAISIRDFENLTLNINDLKRYIEQQQSIIVYYRRMTTKN